MATCFMLSFVYLTILCCVFIGSCKGAMEGFIVGGSYGRITDFPHAVCLVAYCSPETTPSWVCGSSVLNQRVLITAGHCVYDCSDKDEVHALAGSSNIKKVKETKLVKQKVVHEKYDDDTLFSDIALLYLNGDLQFGIGIKRIIVRTSFSDESKAYIAGWGSVNENQDSTVRLKFVKQKVWPLEKCKTEYDLHAGSFCASSESVEDYPYSGDSGSGLVTKKSQLIGLVSFRFDEKPELTYYTNISHFYSWIRTQTHALFCEDRSKGYNGVRIDTD